MNYYWIIIKIKKLINSILTRSSWEFIFIEENDEKMLEKEKSNILFFKNKSEPILAYRLLNLRVSSFINI